MRPQSLRIPSRHLESIQRKAIPQWQSTDIPI
jgi:hypothetical protein